MYYLIKIKHTKQLYNGLLKSVTEPYIITNVDLFTEAESTGFKLIEEYGLNDAIKKVNEYIKTDMRDLSLEKIKKTKIVEII